jgi:two-component system NtrC family sensor kinase
MRQRFGALQLFDGERITLEAHHGPSPEDVTILRQRVFPMRADRGSISGRAIISRAVVHIEDVRTDPEYRVPAVRTLEGYRTFLSAPMLRKDVVLGVINLWRPEVRPFTETQIEMVQTFADQAVIAIENVRLFKELEARNADLTEALDTQTATSDILRVISRSQTDVQPVFDAIVVSAVRLLGAYTGTLSRLAGDQIVIAALTSTDEAGDAAQRALFPQSLHSDGTHAQAIRDRAPLNTADAVIEPRLSEAARVFARVRGYRSLVVMPLLRHDAAIGAIGVTRREPGGFTDDEIALLQTFADQAVIAIENARLLTELQERNTALTQAHAQVTEALEQQTATSEILGVISSSPTDIGPVFEAIVRRAVTLCEGLAGIAVRLEAGRVHLAAHFNLSLGAAELLEEAYPRAPTRDYPAGRAIVDRARVHVFAEDGIAREFPAMAARAGAGSVLAVPLLREGQPIGAITITRRHAVAFTERQIALLQTFADQAVIAIENVRLFRELERRNGELTEALEQQTATGEILQTIAQAQTSVQPVFDTIVRSAVRLCGALHGGVYTFDGELVHARANEGYTLEQLEHWRSTFPRPVTSGSVVVKAIRSNSVVLIDDLETAPAFEVSRETLANLRERGSRSLLAVPMTRHDEVIGAIALAHGRVGAFSETHVELLKTFADQAVIAIENVRLFNETKEALEQQTATSEILRVISSSPTDVQPVLDAIARRAVELCGAYFANVFLVEADLVHWRAGHNVPPEGAAFMRSTYPLATSADELVPAILRERQTLVLEDAEVAFDGERPDSPRLMRNRAIGLRSWVGVPLLREGNAIGLLAGRAGK